MSILEAVTGKDKKRDELTKTALSIRCEAQAQGIVPSPPCSHWNNITHDATEVLLACSCQETWLILCL